MYECRNFKFQLHFDITQQTSSIENTQLFTTHVRQTRMETQERKKVHSERKETSLTDNVIYILRAILSRSFIGLKIRTFNFSFTDSRSFPLWPREYFHRHCLRAHGCLPVFLTALFAFPEPVYQDIICKWPVPASLSLSLSLFFFVSFCRLSRERRIHLRRARVLGGHPAPPFFLLSLFIIIFTLRFH